MKLAYPYKFLKPQIMLEVLGTGIGILELDVILRAILIAITFQKNY